MDQTRSLKTPPPPRRRSLRSTVLGVAAAATVAAWLPFTVFFVNATQHTPAAVVSVKSGTTKSGQQLVTTRTSSGQLVQTTVPAGQSPQTYVAQSAPVSSRSS